MHDTQKSETYSQDFTDTLFQVFTRERNNRNITLEDVYSKLGIHQVTYYRWKNGQTPLSKSIIKKLASALDISADELEALTEYQMTLSKNGMDNSNALHKLRFAKLTTAFDHVHKAATELNSSLFPMYRAMLKPRIFEDLKQSKNEKINNYSFPYHCFNILASRVEGFFDFTLALNWAFSSFPDDTDMKKDIEKIITKHLKTTTIPSSFKKWTTLNTLIQLRNYYLEPESVEHEVKSLDHILYKFDNAIDYVEKSSSIPTHKEKNEANYELIGFAYYYFSEFSHEDLRILFDYLFSFILLSNKKRHNLTTELFSFCSERIGSESAHSANKSTSEN